MPTLEINEDYVFTPCPFCLRAQLTIDAGKNAMVHLGEPCAGFMQARGIRDVTAALARLPDRSIILSGRRGGAG